MPPRTLEEVLLDKLCQMADVGEYAPDITAEAFAAAKSAVFEDYVQFDGEWITHQRGWKFQTGFFCRKTQHLHPKNG
jgi:hypothetical protein